MKKSKKKKKRCLFFLTIQIHCSLEWVSTENCLSQIPISQIQTNRDNVRNNNFFLMFIEPVMTACKKKKEEESRKKMKKKT